MKKTICKFFIFSFFLVSFSENISAQWLTSGNNIYYNNGNVGIGTTPSNDNVALSLYRQENTGMDIRNSVGRLEFGISSCYGCWTSSDVGPGTGAIRTMGMTNNTVLYIPNNSNDGNSFIGIGDQHNGIWARFFNNQTFRMYGTMYAREIIVQSDIWSDFVFDSDYNLLSLEEVESFINENKHLPDIPSADQVLEEGINLSEMNAKLLQKIEEQTLYIIELNKQIQDIKSQLNLK